jgi:hypothetical protein
MMTKKQEVAVKVVLVAGILLIWAAGSFAASSPGSDFKDQTYAVDNAKAALRKGQQLAGDAFKSIHRRAPGETIACETADGFLVGARSPGNPDAATKQFYIVSGAKS